MKIIAHIYTPFNEKFGIPRQSGLSPVPCKIVFKPEYRNPDALKGIEGFSHLWVIWQFSKSIKDSWQATVRPPRLGGNKSVGVFATRSPMRPNSIGLSSVKLERIEETQSEGTVLWVSGADILSGTPVYDIKPYLAYTDSHPDAVDGFAAEVVSHSLTVVDESNLLDVLSEEEREAVVSLLEQDPRPGYQNDSERIYGMSYGEWNIKFKVEEDCAVITECSAK